MVLAVLCANPLCQGPQGATAAPALVVARARRARGQCDTRHAQMMEGPAPFEGGRRGGGAAPCFLLAGLAHAAGLRVVAGPSEPVW